MKRRIAYLATMLPIAALIVSAPPAEASVTGGFSSPTQVLYPSCHEVSINYSLQISTDTDYWNLDIDVVTPDGTVDGSAYLASSLGDSPVGAFTYYLCGFQMAGTYTIRGSGEFTTYTSDTYFPYALPESAFTVRQAETKTVLKKRPGSLTVRVQDERPNGYYPTAYASIYFETFKNGRWSRLPRSKDSVDEKGRVRYRVQDIDRYLKLRAVTQPDDYAGSTSRPVTLRP